MNDKTKTARHLSDFVIIFLFLREQQYQTYDGSEG